MAKAEDRLLRLEQPAIVRLEELMLQSEFPSVAIAAVKDVLDRVRGRATEKHDVTVSGDDAFMAVLTGARTRLARHRALPE